MSQSHPSRAATLPLARIRPGFNPRRYFDPGKHDELVASLRLRGMIQPILVRPVAGEDLYETVAGGRRYRAGLEAFGPEGEVPVVIRDMTDQEALEAAIDENDVRDDASETEQADAAVRALAASHGDHAEAARRLAWSRAKLDRRLALAELAPEVKLALDERRIKVGHAELLAAVPGDKQAKALETILAASLDVAKTRELLMRVMQVLAAAAFDKRECTTCPFNSASQRTLFETHIDDGHCTNPTCFQLKTEAANEACRQKQEQEQAVEADLAAADADVAAPDESDNDDSELAFPSAPSLSVPAAGPIPASPAAKADARTTSPHKATVTAKSIAARTTDLREATWRTAVARALAAQPPQAHTAILVAAMTGTLSQIKAETLRGRAGLLVGATFPGLAFGDQVAAIRALSLRGLGEAPLPLFAAADEREAAFSPEGREPAVELARLSDGQEVVADYRSLQMSLRAHPLAFLRDELGADGVTRCADLAGIRDGRRVKVSGLILVRQKPGSAKGVLFITIEDETGVANGILWPDRFEAQRLTVMSAHMVTMVGRLQREGEVTHVIIDRLVDEGARLARIGGMSLPHRTGRGDGARHAGAPDRGDPGWRPRDLYWPLLADGQDPEEVVRIKTRDFR